ncbi:MAG: hypothetical protein HY556_09490 [Euryarchaeota archaeon]|nr:hypothetical protein [Euryarchaeota archaeon]
MAFVWNDVGAFASGVAIIMWPLAALILFRRPDRAQNRLLAVAIVFESIALAGGAGLLFLTDDPRTAYAWQRLNTFALPAFSGVYLLFLGTLPSPLSAPFRTRRGSAVVVLGIGAAWAAALLWPAAFVPGVQRVSYATWDGVSGPYQPVLTNMILAAYTYGFVVSLDAWRRASAGTLQKTQMGLFLLAFGVRDFFGAYAFGYRLVNSALGTQLPSLNQLVGVPNYVQFPAYILLFLLLVSYAMLKVQLFDVDLRVKWTIRQSTVAAAFVAVFFVVSQLAQTVLQSSLGPIAGVLAAGALVFVLAPLNRLAQRVSDAAMPNVKETEGYKTVRKREVYRAAFLEAAADGELTEKDRNVLATLADQLGLSNMDAREVEKEAAARSMEVT